MSDTTTCPECGKTVPVHRYCNDCGASLDAANDTPAEAVVEPSDEATDEVQQPVENDSATATTSGNEEVQELIYGLLREGRTPSEIARKCNALGLGWDGEPREWSATNVDWFRRNLQAGERTVEAAGEDTQTTAGPVPLAQLRSEAGLSEDELAHRAGIRVKWIQYGETGDAVVPESYRAKIAEALGVPQRRIYFAGPEPSPLAPPSQPVIHPTHGQGRKTPEQIRASNRKWLIGAGCGVGLLVLLVVMSGRDSARVEKLWENEGWAVRNCEQVGETERDGSLEASIWSCEDEDDDSNWCVEYLTNTSNGEELVQNANSGVGGRCDEE